MTKGRRFEIGFFVKKRDENNVPATGGYKGRSCAMKWMNLTNYFYDHLTSILLHVSRRLLEENMFYEKSALLQNGSYFRCLPPKHSFYCVVELDLIIVLVCPLLDLLTCSCGDCTIQYRFRDRVEEICAAL